MHQIPQTYKQRRIADLTPHPANPNQGDIGAIHTSITANGWYGAVITQKSTGYILAGNHRIIAAREAGAEKVPVIELDCDDQTATRILLADNRTNRLGNDDPDAVANLLRDLIEHDGIEGTGYDADDLDTLISEPAPLDLTDTPTNAKPVECPNCGHTFNPSRGGTDA